MDKHEILEFRIKRMSKDVDTALPYRKWVKNTYEQKKAVLYVERKMAGKRWHKKSMQSRRRKLVKDCLVLRATLRYSHGCDECKYSYEHKDFFFLLCMSWREAIAEMEYPYNTLPHFGRFIPYKLDENGEEKDTNPMREILDLNLGLFCPHYNEIDFLAEEDENLGFTEEEKANNFFEIND